MRGADVSADADDHVVLLDKKRKLKSYDVMLKQFRYGDALDEALNGRQLDAVSIFTLSMPALFTKYRPFCCLWMAFLRFISYNSVHFITTVAYRLLQSSKS